MSRFTHITTTAVVTTAMISSYVLWLALSPHQKRKRLRQKLPFNLENWRLPGGMKTTTVMEEQIWTYLDEVLRNKGYLPWKHAFHSILVSPGATYPLSSGFGYAMHSRTKLNQVGNVGRLRRFEYRNPLIRIVRTREGHDVAIRVVAIGNEGLNHLAILKKIGAGENSFYSNNHTLPLFAEFQFEDIIFCVFPKVGESCSLAYGWWAKNSVGDILDMIMQMLEALAFIHNLRIAHRDAFHDNFLVQWHPESLVAMKISPSRPRVYLTDFESAIQCPQDCPEDECLMTGYPLGDSVEAMETYARPPAPELKAQKPYSPFKLDIWQLGAGLSDFRVKQLYFLDKGAYIHTLFPAQSTIPSIDEILVAMTDANFASRFSANEALSRLQAVVHSMAPESLLIEPLVIEDHR